ncbi:hypothetical protein M3J09_006367 [Ascochyta lentis]
MSRPPQRDQPLSSSNCSHRVPGRHRLSICPPDCKTTPLKASSTRCRRFLLARLQSRTSSHLVSVPRAWPSSC